MQAEARTRRVYDPDDDHWERLRDALAPYGQYGSDAKAALLADLLRSFERQGTPWVTIAHAAANANVELATGRLSTEQRLFREAGFRRLGEPIGR